MVLGAAELLAGTLSFSQRQTEQNRNLREFKHKLLEGKGNLRSLETIPNLWMESLAY